MSASNKLALSTKAILFLLLMSLFTALFLILDILVSSTENLELSNQEASIVSLDLRDALDLREVQAVYEMSLMEE